MSSPVSPTPTPTPASPGNAARRLAPPERLTRALARIAAAPHANPAERARTLLAAVLEATGAGSAHLASGDGRVSALLDAGGAFAWRDAADGREPRARPGLGALPRHDGTGALAVPVHDLAGETIGALSCGGVGPGDLDPDRIDALTLAALAAAPLLAPPPASRAHALAEHAPDILVEVSRDGMVTWANPALREVLGIDPAEIVGRPALEALPPEERERVSAALSGTNGRRPVRLAARHRDGSPRWLELTVADELADPAVGAIVLAARDVTARVAAEEALAAEDAMLRSVVDVVPDHIWVKDAGLRYRMVNRAAAEAFGFGAPEAAIGRTVRDVYPPEAAAAAEAEDARVLERGETLTGLVRRGTADPGRWFMTTKAPLRDASGAVAGLVGISRDVTERKLAEDAAGAERDLLQAVMDAIPDRIWVKDRDGRMTRLNRAAVDRFRRFGPEEPLGRTVADFFAPERAGEIAAQDAAVLAGEPLLDSLEPERDGEAVRWRLVSKAPLRDEAGEIAGLIGISRDVTGRKEIEDALAAERDLLQEILDAIPDWVFLKDPAGRYLRVNQAFADDLGLASPAEAVGRTVESYAPAAAHGEIRDEDAAALAADGEVVTQVFDRAAQDGAVHTYRLVKRTLHGADGAATAILGMASDITEIEATRARLAAALEEQRAANAELERVNAAKSGIVSMLGHEFRTPLTSIQGYAALIRDYPLEPAEVAESAGEILRGAQRLAGLVDDVLALDQVQHGMGMAEIALRPVDLGDVLGEVLRLLAPQASGHEVSLAVEDGLPPALGDSGRLAQVFTNLVGNAIKYAPDGGEIAVAARREGDLAVVTVRDEGIGIPPDRLEAIFEPYVRLPEAKRRGIVGTGLGLPITRTLVEAMGGTVAARNVPGGSEFAVRLPLAE